MPNPIVDAFHSTVSLDREAIFPDSTLMPVTQVEDAATPAPGWVGSKWQPGGTLLMAINPGGGGDSYRLNRTDERLYGLIRAFRSAHADSRENALAALSAAAIEIQKTYNLHRLIGTVVDALGVEDEALAFLNMLPFRTRMDKPAGSAILRKAWAVSTGRQVEALQPRRIIALGRKAFDALNMVGATKQYDVVYLKRAIGDSYITAEARAAITALKGER